MRGGAKGARAPTNRKSFTIIGSPFQIYGSVHGISAVRIDYGDDGTMHALVHSNLNSSALDYPN